MRLINILHTSYCLIGGVFWFLAVHSLRSQQLWIPVDGYPFPFKTVQSNMPSAPSFSSSRRVPAVSNFISFTSSSTKGVSVYKTPTNVTLTMSAGTKPPAEWSGTSNERWKRGLTPLLWSACLDDALVSRQTDRWTGKDDQESRTGSIRVDSWPRLG